MEHRGPWIRHDSEVLLDRQFFRVMSDTVTSPSGTRQRYDWVSSTDYVRTAAWHEGRLIIAAQHHYLPNVADMWQLPGGAIDPADADPAAAAARELAEEAGVGADNWHQLGAVWTSPGLSNARVHLFVAEGLTPAHGQREATEADLTTRSVPLSEAVTAALDGTIGCAASALLVLKVAISLQLGATNWPTANGGIGEQP